MLGPGSSGAWDRVGLELILLKVVALGDLAHGVQDLPAFLSWVLPGWSPTPTRLRSGIFVIRSVPHPQLEIRVLHIFIFTRSWLGVERPGAG